MSDNRRSIRIRTDARVDVASDTEVLLFHKIRDIGEGGMSLEFPTLEPLGTLVDLSISLPGQDAALECTGEVVRASEVPVRHLGIRFRELTEAQVDLLRRYLASRDGGTGEAP